MHDYLLFAQLGAKFGAGFVGFVLSVLFCIALLVVWIALMVVLIHSIRKLWLYAKAALRRRQARKAVERAAQKAEWG